MRTITAALALSLALVSPAFAGGNGHGHGHGGHGHSGAKAGKHQSAAIASPGDFHFYAEQVNPAGQLGAQNYGTASISAKGRIKGTVDGWSTLSGPHKLSGKIGDDGVVTGTVKGCDCTLTGSYHEAHPPGPQGQGFPAGAGGLIEAGPQRQTYVGSWSLY